MFRIFVRKTIIVNQYIHFDQSHLQLVLSQILRLRHLGVSHR